MYSRVALVVLTLKIQNNFSLCWRHIFKNSIVLVFLKKNLILNYFLKNGTLYINVVHNAKETQKKAY